MNMMRIGPDGKNLVCRNCLERSPAKEQVKTETKTQKQESGIKEYFCKACKYNFSRPKHVSMSVCPYCSASGSLMTKGSTAKIIADAAKMKGD